MAVLGIIQGFLQIFHIYIYVRQINRINGFSYEPSYYSAYMLAGWVMFAYLLEARSYEIVSRRVLYRYFAATSMVLLLSTSKLAWATMAGWLAFRTVNIVFHMILGKVREDKLVFLIILPILAAIGFALILFLDSKWDIIGRYTSGLGLFGSSGHSANARRRQLNNTIGVLKKSPFLGYSYGGVDPAIASYSGTEYKGNGGGMNVLIETAIALGIGGAILFVYFLYEITVRFIRHHRKNHILNAVVLGLLVQFGELMFNQNIQRTYFWISIAMVCVVEKEIIKRNYFYIKN
jgi:hypothetical protein